MKKGLALVLSVLMIVCCLTGCGGTKDKLIGTWTSSDVIAIELTFKNDGTGSIGSSGFNMQCDWKLDGDTIVFSSDMIGEQKMKIVSISGDTLKLDNEDGTTTELKKK